ncbi:hypothetical protein B0A48_07872 [Cryoendolithus antarcticus]|uniref:Dihydrolipoamide acetyltransferase component of pyruvate dehydrogenase complex n=1 Tax=Cryoendolithus antarcticus TaxID=1507870 RepID=A0A1V8T0B3_9PEZI|nr:hypothetical protein B0A48_07872 [Cryoendolithus antarcticus]
MATFTPRIARSIARQTVSQRRQCLYFRSFTTSHRQAIVKPFLLADIGEGITECQVIQWFVQPGARVEQFDKLCEVQSDKASVDITSPFDGVIKKLHYAPDDMAITGKPLVDIDIQGEIGEEESNLLGGADKASTTEKSSGVETVSREQSVKVEGGVPSRTGPSSSGGGERTPRKVNGDLATLATPAVRHLTKELNVKISDVSGSGRDGRVLKEDVHRHVSQASTTSIPSQPQSTPVQGDRTTNLTPVQNQMFKLMTRSLTIPHFLYSCSADMTGLTGIRKTLNGSKTTDKLTHLPFILKAVSMALRRHTLLNSTLDTSDPKKPTLTSFAAHNFGVAVDTPSGLLVPVLKTVQNMSIGEIASRLRELSEKARNNKLAPDDFKGATFTVSNIGSVGGGVVSPVISEPQVAILGIGRSRVVPAFDANDELVKREELVLSWSADHRVVDGAECARCAERVKSLLEAPAAMLVEMR